MGKKLGSAPWLRGTSGPDRVAKAWRGKEGYKESKALEKKGIPNLILSTKPLMKKVKPAIDKSRKDIRQFRKDQAKTESGKKSKTLNKAQERLETARATKDVTLKIMQRNKTWTKKEHKTLGAGFDKVIRKRAEVRNALAHPDKVGKHPRKSNYKGGLVTGIPKLARKGF